MHYGRWMKWGPTSASFLPKERSPLYPWKSPLTEALFVQFIFAVCHKRNDGLKDGTACERDILTQQQHFDICTREPDTKW